MTMPLNLVLVRHGQSELNYALQQAEKGNTSLNDTIGFVDVHDSRYRLTTRGREQAALAGRWLRENALGYFDRRYTSQYARAMETAALLDIDGSDWYIEAMLREREWGDVSDIPWDERENHPSLTNPHKEGEPFYWVPRGGESIAGLVLRLRSVLDTLHRECSEMNVIIVAHGEVMWALRYMLERMTVDRWTKFISSDNPDDHIKNCQIIHYSRHNPSTGAVSSHLDWMRMIIPTDKNEGEKSWSKIIRPTFTNSELLKLAERSPQFFIDFDERQH